MIRKFFLTLGVLSFCISSASLATTDNPASSPAKHGWVNISEDSKPFDKHCDYKVWLLEEGEWRETWYLEAFDAENAFYTIARQSSDWSNDDDFYALNYKDKTKFLTSNDVAIDVVPFKLCIKSD